MHSWPTRLLGMGVLAVASSLTAGCRALPDAGPLVSSSVELRAAVAAGGAAVKTELQSVPAPDDAEPYAQQFANLWNPRVKACDGLVEYATSISSIVQATQESRQRIATLATSITELAGAAGIVVPASSAAFGAATHVAQMVYEQIARVRASQTLDQAMGAAQGAVDEICAKVAGDLRTANDLVLLATADEISSIENRFNIETGYREALLVERSAIYVRGAPATGSQDIARLKEIDDLLVMTETWHGPQQAEIKAIEARRDAAQNMILAAAAAIDAWPIAHARFREAAKSGQTLDPQALLAAIAEVRDLIKRMRDQ